MELKSLKIDSELHEKLKDLSDEKNTSMQNLVEKKLLELVSHEDDILFDFDKIKYDPQFKKYNLELNENSFNKLITFFEIFLTNRNVKNIKEIENLLQLISKLKDYESNKIKKVKEEVRESINNTFVQEDTLVNMINKAIKENAPKETEKEFNYKDIESGYNNSLRTLLTQIDSVRFSMAKNDLKEAFENLNGHDFMSPLEEEKDKTQTKFDKKMKLIEDLRIQINKPSYLNVGDIVTDPKTNFEYKIEKVYQTTIYESPSYVLRGITALTMDIEALLTLDSLIKQNYLMGDKLLLEVIDSVDFNYEKNINKVADIKTSLEALAKELTIFRSRETIANHFDDITSKIDNLDKSEALLDYELLKDLFMKTKLWFEEFKFKNAEI